MPRVSPSATSTLTPSTALTHPRAPRREKPLATGKYFFSPTASSFMVRLVPSPRARPSSSPRGRSPRAPWAGTSHRRWIAAPDTGERRGNPVATAPGREAALRSRPVARASSRHPAGRAEALACQDDRHPGRRRDLFEELQILGLDGHVQRGGGLIGDEQAWGARERDGARHPL